MPLFSDDPEMPMSADLLQRCVADGSLTVHEIADLLNRSQSCAYDYLGRTELRYGQARTLFRHADSDGIREAILQDLLPGTGYIAQRIDASLDVDGDGDVDLDDAIAAGIAAVSKAAESLRQLHAASADQRVKADQAQAMLTTLHSLLGQVATTANVVRYLRDLEAKRRPARQMPLGLATGEGGRR